METTSRHSLAGNRAYQDEVFIQQFSAVLAQINVDNIVLLAASVRQDMQARHIPEDADLPVSADNPAIGCKVFSEPLRGSYNLAYRVLFDDGLEWILKIPANGSRARFNSLAADALTSEALTMKMLKRATTIPIPTIYSFDASLNNEIGCPYILMEFLKGRPLYEGWFDAGASSAKLEQFRARALQTVAAAMVQLNEFTLHRGGALRFSAAGEPVDVVGAKVPDINAYYDGDEENPCPEHDVWCRKGPTADPSDYFLFHLNRRGYQERDSEYSRGVYESTRLFAKWALDLSQNMYPQGPHFVLAHPDLDLQNILVLEDGTLAGILDWDGVAAVPLSVGCLKLPNWLIRDWDLNNYNWDVEAHVPKLRSGRLENTPDELLAYRAMYAQFIEMLLSSNSANDTARKMGAHITRLSLISLTLENAANNRHSTGQTIGQLFRKMKQASGEPDDDDVSETGAVASDIGSGDGPDEGPDEEPNVSDGERSDEDSLARWDEAEGGNSDEDTTPTEVENSASDLSDDAERRLPERPGEDRIATVHESSLGGVNKKIDETDHSVLAAPDTTLHEPAEIELKVHEMPPRDQTAAGETTRDQNAVTSRKVRGVQWALGLGVKGCRKACKAFYKGETAVPLSPDDPGTAMPGAFIQTPVGRGIQHASMDTNTDAHVPEKIDLVGASCEQTPHQSRGSEGDEATEMDPENVWAQIAADIDKGGIPIDWIKKRRDVIAQCIIENLGQEIEQEKEKELRLKNKKENKTTKRARQPTRKTNGNHKSVPSSDQNPSVESAAVVAVERNLTLVEKSGTSMAEKSDSTNQSHVSALAEAEFEVNQVEKPASAKPEPEHAAFPESSITLPGKFGPKTVQLKDTNPQKSKPNNARAEIAKKADPKQRLSSSNLAEPRVANTDLDSAFGQAGENDLSTTEHHRNVDSQTWKLNDPFYRAVDTANGYAMAMLEKMREQDVANEILHDNSSPIAVNAEEDSDSENGPQTSPSTSVSAIESSNLAVQPKASVMSGRWFETPRGSLKRLDDQDMASDSLSDPERSSRLSKSCSEENGGSSETSMTTHELDDMAGSSSGQLLSPQHSQSQNTNVFQVPSVGDDDGDDDSDEDEDSDDGGVKLEDLTQNNDGELSNESDDGDLSEENVQLVNEGSENAGGDEQEDRGPIVTLDYGAFNMHEVCVALGRGNLDEARMKKLKDMFHVLLAEVLGRI